VPSNEGMAPAAQRRRVSSGPWAFLWAGLLFPLICVGPVAGLALLSAALPGALGDLWYVLRFLLIPAGVLSAIVSVLFALNASTDSETRVPLVVVALIGNALAMAAGVAAMERAVHIACDPYDCF
jgi:hypothetical protein